MTDIITAKKAPWNKGIKIGSPSEETRKKLSEALTGRKLSDEHRKKIGEAHKGKTISEETREKMRGPHTLAHREKQSITATAHRKAKRYNRGYNIAKIKNLAAVLAG